MVRKRASATPGALGSSLRKPGRQISREEYHQLFDLVPDVVILVDNETECILEANAAATALYGYAREDLIGMRSIFLSAEPEETRRAVAEHRKGMLIRSHRKKDGTVFPVEIAARYFERGGRQVHLAAIRDITERKRVEDALLESEDRAKRALETNRVLAEIGRIVSSTLSLESVYDQFVLEIKKIIPSDRISIGLIDAEHRTFCIAYTSGLEITERAMGKSLPLPHTIRRVVEEGAGYILLADERGFPEEYPTLCHAFRRGIRSLIFAPLFSKDEVIGTLFLGSFAFNAYTKRDLEIAEDVSRQIGGAVASAQLYARIKEAETSLRTSEERFRELYESAPLGYLESDEQGRVTSVNRRLTQMLGYASEEIVGRPLWNLVTKTDAREEVRAKLCGKKPPGRGFELAVMGKDGTTLFFLVDEMIQKDREGRIIGLRSTLLDITARKKAEDALRRSEERFRLLVENAPDAVFVRIDGRFAYVNPAALRLFGVSSAEQLLGQLILDWVDPDGRAIVAARMKHIDEVHEGFPLRKQRLLRADGTLVDVEASPVPFVYEGRKGALIFARDVTKRKKTEEENKRLQEQLHQAQKMESVGRLAGGVAHDFNNMLGIIIGQAEMASIQSPADAPIHQSLQEILKAARRSADTVRQLLAFARKQTISPKLLDLNETVSGMIKMLRRLIGEDITLHWLPGKDLGMVRMDPSQVNQILANLIVNSRDAIAGVGKITIESANAVPDESCCRENAGVSPGKYVLLSVSDTGTGMTPEVKAHLFDPFFTTKEVGKGTGLGLATVYGIVKQNNGFINVYSEAGQGTAIKMYFPCFEGKADGASEKSDEQRLPRGKETVLIAEDEDSLLKIARDILERQGYTVLAARTPGEAILLAQKHPGEIHLLLADVVMPEMNGSQLLERLRAGRPAVKSLFMSGYTADVVAPHGVLDEGVDFIEKPFSSKALAEKVRQVLDR